MFPNPQDALPLPLSNFEAAADAIVSGDVAALERLLHDDPELVRARSTREHRATLLHYVSANGVEGWRQMTPKNAVEIATLLLDAGAEVDAEADVYGGGATTLGLVATSIWPFRAGVQNALMRLLLDRGARIRPDAVIACLANGRPEAAAFLAAHGAPVDFRAAAGLGRLDLVREQLTAAFLWACQYGRNDVVEFLLEKEVDLAAADRNGQTALHHAVIGGQLATIKLLMDRDAPLDAVNVYGGTVLGQARCSAANGGGDPDVYAAIIEALIAAGAAE